MVTFFRMISYHAFATVGRSSTILYRRWYYLFATLYWWWSLWWLFFERKIIVRATLPWLFDFLRYVIFYRIIVWDGYFLSDDHVSCVRRYHGRLTSVDSLSSMLSSIEMVTFFRTMSYRATVGNLPSIRYHRSYIDRNATFLLAYKLPFHGRQNSVDMLPSIVLSLKLLVSFGR